MRLQRRRVAVLAAMIALLAAVVMYSGTVSGPASTDTITTSIEPDDPFGADLLDQVRGKQASTAPSAAGQRSATQPPTGPTDDDLSKVTEDVQRFRGSFADPAAPVEPSSDDSDGRSATSISHGGSAPAASAFVFGAAASAPGVFANGAPSRAGVGGAPAVGGALAASSAESSFEKRGDSGPTAGAFGDHSGGFQTGGTHGSLSGSVDSWLAGPPLHLETIDPTHQADNLISTRPAGLILTNPGEELADGPLYAGSPSAPPRVVNPEPASLLLLGTGLALAARQLRRRKV